MIPNEVRDVCDQLKCFSSVITKDTTCNLKKWDFIVSDVLEFKRFHYFSVYKSFQVSDSINLIV